MIKRSWLVILGCIAVVAVGFGLWWKDSAIASNPEQYENATLLPKPATLEEFNLTDDQGHPFTKENLKGQWNLIFFGFTHCAMICPTALSELNKAHQVMEQKNQGSMPRVVFVTVDPERDSPAQMHKYLQTFNKSFIGLTGPSQALEKMTKQLGIAYMKATKSGENDYQIDHTASVLVINPKGEWVAVLSTPHKAETLAKNIELIQKKYQD